VSLQQLYERYHDRVQFLAVYIREAHPTDGWSFAGDVGEWMIRKYAPRTSTSLAQPSTTAERRAAATRCEDALQYGIRTYVDEIDDAVCEAYAALPTRLYLVGPDGRVLYAGGLGPYGFKPAHLDRAILRHLDDTAP
jgi:hypothetical protein